LRYIGSSAPALARDVLLTLEMHFSASIRTNYSPPDSIVISFHARSIWQTIIQAPDGRAR